MRFIIKFTYLDDEYLRNTRGNFGIIQKAYSKKFRINNNLKFVSSINRIYISGRKKIKVSINLLDFIIFRASRDLKSRWKRIKFFFLLFITL